jgi:hypothetical protein
MTHDVDPVEQRLQELRDKVLRIRSARRILDEYLLTVGSVQRKNMMPYLNWLNNQEAKVTKLGLEIKNQQQRLQW